MTLLAKRYASALFALADAAGVADVVGGDLAAMHGDLVGKGARDLLLSPNVGAAARGVVLEKLGHARHPLVRNLIGVLQVRRRLEVLFDLHPEFRQLLLVRRGEVEGVLESPRAIDEAQLRTITAMAGRLTGKKVTLTTKQAPELLGGARLRVGNVLYDGSIKAALAQLENRLMQAAI